MHAAFKYLLCMRAALKRFAGQLGVLQTPWALQHYTCGEFWVPVASDYSIGSRKNGLNL